MLKGKTVQHRVYGSGAVIDVQGDAAYVQFRGAGSRAATRKFLLAALFDDALFPHDRNAEIWRVRGLDAHKRSKALSRENESEMMQRVLDLNHKPTDRPGPNN